MGVPEGWFGGGRYELAKFWDGKDSAATIDLLTRMLRGAAPKS
jgi:hypothetical protein